MWLPALVPLALLAAVAESKVLRLGKHSRLRLPFSKEAEHSHVTQIKKDYPFYHDAHELSGELRRLAAGGCRGASLKVEKKEEDGVSIEVAFVRRQGRVATDNSTAAAINRVFVVSGEHSREVIGPESTIRFLRALCSDDVRDGEPSPLPTNVRAADVLQDAEFAVVVNANPRSRAKVDDGEYCVRENPNGVDLNRNWDEQWNSRMTLVTSRGARPFSEPETRILRRLLQDFKPTTFLSVHSGTAGMYMPWAWSVDSLANRNQPAMMQLLSDLDRRHCRCPFGAAGKEVGYPCPGTSVDWVYDKLGASFSFAFEIWGDVDMEVMHQRWREKADAGGHSLLMMGANLGHPHFQEVFHAYPSEFVQMNASVQSRQPNDMDSASCFTIFNPDVEETFAKSVDNWAAAYLEMVVNISALLKVA